MAARKRSSLQAAVDVLLDEIHTRGERAGGFWLRDTPEVRRALAVLTFDADSRAAAAREGKSSRAEERRAWIRSALDEVTPATSPAACARQVEAYLRREMSAKDFALIFPGGVKRDAIRRATGAKK